MKKLSLKTVLTEKIFISSLCPVFGITRGRMSGIGQMGTDLVAFPCDEFNLKERQVMRTVPVCAKHDRPVPRHDPLCSLFSCHVRPVHDPHCIFRIIFNQIAVDRLLTVHFPDHKAPVILMDLPGGKQF